MSEQGKEPKPNTEKSITPQNAYESYQCFVKKCQEITNNVKGWFDYSPFEYLPSKFSRELWECRSALIKQLAEQQRKQFMPNISLDRFPGFEGFEKLMDKAVGRENFDNNVITQWFVAQLARGPEMEAEAARQLLERASHFLPWHSGEKTSQISEFYDGKRTLTLEAHTWSGGRVAYELNYGGKFEALEKVIRMAIIAEKAAAPNFGGPIWRHVTSDAQGEAVFYRKEEPATGPVQSFVFTKNGKLVVRFKTDQQARAVAELLLVGRKRKAT